MIFDPFNVGIAVGCLIILAALAAVWRLDR